MRKQFWLCALFLWCGILGVYSQSRVILLPNEEGGGYTEITNSYALIIGESGYRYWDSLPGVGEDVRAVKKLLEEQGFNVEYAMDLDRAALRSRVDDFLGAYGFMENTRLLLYYAGHGFSLNGDGYIVPVDAPGSGAGPEFLRKIIPLEQFITWIKPLQSRHIMLMFDSCFSGSLFLTRSDPASIKYSKTLPVRHFITSGSEGEVVPDKSIFRMQFETGLRERAADLDGDGYVTGTELGEFLKTTVTNYSDNNQHPLSGKMNHPDYNKGDFVFEVSSPEEREALALGSDPYSRGLEYFNRGEHDKAIAEFSLSIKNNMMNSALAYKFRGNSYFARGEYEKAAADYGQTLLIYPDETSVVINRAAALYKLGEYTDSLADLSRIISLYPDTAEAWNYRGNVYAAMGQYDKAIADYGRALDINPGDALALNSRGAAYQYRGDYERAVADFTAALVLAPGNTVLRNNRGIVYLQLGEEDRAIQAYSGVIQGDPDNPAAYYHRGKAYTAKGELEHALADFNRALVLRPGFPEAVLARAEVHAVMGDLDRAIGDYGSLILQDPGFTGAYFGRADVLVAKADWDGAAADFERGFADLAKGGIHEYINSAGDLLRLFYRNFPYFTPAALESIPGAPRLALLVRDCVSQSIERMESARGVRGAGQNLRELCFYYAGLDLEASFGSVEKAFLYSEALRNRGLLEEMGIDIALRLPGVSAEERDRAMDLRARLASLQDLRGTLNRRERIDSDADYGAEVQRQRDAAEQELALLYEAIGRRIPRFWELASPVPMNLEQALAFCGEDRAFLEYAVWDAYGEFPGINAYCLILDKKGLTPVRLDLGFAYNEAVRNLNAWVLTAAGRFGASENHEKSRNDLYNKLIKPALAVISADMTNMVIVPDGALAHLPFDILREDAESPDFGESYRLSFSVSLSGSAMAAKPGPAVYEPILALGGPLYDGGARERGAERSVVIIDDNSGDSSGYSPSYNRRWANLPGTEREVKNIGGLAEGSSLIITGAGVSEAKLKELSRTGELRRYKILHFALAGYFNEEVPSDSVLVFSEVSGLIESEEDGYLTPSEAAMLDLDASVAVLSVCDTVRGSGGVGFIRSIMTAGAAAVLATLGGIEDEGTVLFMTNLYARVIGEGMSFGDALFTVKNEFRQGRHGGEYADPFYWAQFVLWE